MYESWLNDRDTVHALSNYPVYWNSLRWTFVGTTLNHRQVPLHTGFTWLGVGAIVKKSLVQHFLNHQLPRVPLERRGLADNYFSIMTNRVPTIIIVPLSTEQLDQSNPYSSALRIVNTLDIARKEAIAMVCAGEIPFLTPAVPSKYTAPEIKRSMKAASATRAYDTRFQGWYVLSRSFMTNIRLKEIQPTSVEQYQSDQRVWDYMHTSQYAQKYVDINKWNHLHPLDEVRRTTMWYGNKYIELDEVRDVVKARKKKNIKQKPSPYQPYYTWKQIHEFSLFESHPPLHAIDQEYFNGSPQTYWESVRPIQKNDWFGLDLGGIKVSLHELVVKGEKEVREMKLEISSDGITWIAFTLMHKLKDKLCGVSTLKVEQEWRYKLRHVQKNTPRTNCHEIRYDLRRIQGRYIRFVADWDFGASLKVWDMRIEHMERDLVDMKENMDYM